MLSPLFTIEAITTARQARYFVVRFLYATALLFVLWMSYESDYAIRNAINTGTIANVAGAFFNQFIWMQITAVLLITPSLTAGTIAGELERKTLDYLLASPLSSFSILAGKLGARLLLATLLIAAGMPVLAMAMMMGGIPPLMLLRVTILTLATLLAVGSLALSVSAWSVRTRDAVIRSYLLLLALLVVPPITQGMGSALMWNTSLAWMQPAMEWLLVVPGLITVVNPYWLAYTSEASHFFWGITAYIGFSIAVLAWTSWRLRAIAAGRSAGSAKRRWQWRLWSYRQKLGDWPIAWREMYVERTAARWGCLARLALVAMICCFAAIVIGIFTIQGLSSNAEPFVVLYGWVAPLIVLAATVRGATLISAEREQDTWLTLTSTPLSGKEIVTGKLLGNVYALRWPVGAMAVLWCGIGLWFPPLLIRIPFVLGTLLLLLTVCSLWSLHCSLVCRTSLSALGMSLGTIIFVGGGYLCCCVPLMMVGTAGRGGDSEMMLLLLSPCIPFLLVVPGIPFPNSQLFEWPLRDEAFAAIAAFGFGIMIYSVIGVHLYRRLTEEFDRLIGRTLTNSDQESPMISHHEHVSDGR